MYEFSCHLNEEDYVAFNINHMQIMPFIRKKLQLQRFIYPLFFLAIPAFFFKDNLKVGMIFAICLGFVWMTTYPKHTEKNVRKRVKKIMKQSENKEALEDVHYQINDEYIKETRGESELFREWDRASEISITDKYLYVYFGIEEASIIPKRVFETQEEQEAFVEFCNKKIEANTHLQ